MRVRFDRSIAPAEPVLRTVLLAIGLALLAAARWFPFSSLPPLCSFKALTGLPCVSCGMTRSWVYGVHGRFLDAWLMSPLGTLLFVGVVGAVGYGLLRSARAIPAVRVDLRPFETIAVRTTVVLAILLNWGFVISAGRA